VYVPAAVGKKNRRLPGGIAAPNDDDFFILA
jgi:hypothetical protein